VQTAAKLLLEPIFEADFDPNAYGYRPKRSAPEAIQKVHQLLNAGYTDVVDADLSKYFDNESTQRRCEPQFFHNWPPTLFDIRYMTTLLFWLRVLGEIVTRLDLARLVMNATSQCGRCAHHDCAPR
jgi:hypothetical protein